MKKILVFLFSFFALSLMMGGNVEAIERVIEPEDGLEERIPGSGYYVPSGGENPAFNASQSIENVKDTIAHFLLLNDEIVRVSYKVIGPDVGGVRKSSEWFHNCKTDTSLDIEFSIDDFPAILNGEYELTEEFSFGDLPQDESFNSPAQNTYYILLRGYKKSRVFSALDPIFTSCPNRGSRVSELDTLIPVIYSEGGDAFGTTGYELDGTMLNINFRTDESILHNMKFFHSSKSPATLKGGNEKLTPSDFESEYLNTTGTKQSREMFIGTQVFSSKEEIVELGSVPSSGEYTYFLIEDINGNKRVFYFDYDDMELKGEGGETIEIPDVEDDEGSVAKIIQIIAITVGGVLFIAVSLLVIQKIVDRKKFV